MSDAESPRAPSDEDEKAFQARYYQHVAADDLAGWSPAEITALAEGHLDFARVRPPGAPKVRVSARDVRLRHAVVDIVTDDMPFLVDSVTQELARQDIAITLLIHPQFVVRRDLQGKLLEVLGTLDAHEAPADAFVESWMHIEVGSLHDADAEESLRRDLVRVLRDVRDAVEDWARMRALASRTATDIEADPPPSVPASEVAEVAEFLRWLADDHFTFLGCRDYRLVDDDEGIESLAAVAGSGLGLLRGDQPRPRRLIDLPPGVQEQVHDPQLLIITKTNARSTVHRAVHLDYMGIKLFDREGVVVGERRFLGLLTSAAYTQQVSQIPLLRRKVAAVLDMSGYSPTSHNGKDLLNILEDHPRDDMFQISVPELYDVAIGVLQLQERRRLRLFMRRDVYGRLVSCLVYLPRDRYNTDVRLKMRAILLETLHGAAVEDTFRVAESVLARVHFVVRLTPESPREFDVAEVERRLVVATRTWQDDFEDALAARFGDDADAALTARYSDVFPEAYKEDFAAADGVRDLVKLEGLTSDELEPELYEPADTHACDLALKLYRRGSPVSLSQLLPMLQSMGVEVTDERPYEIGREGAETLGWVYDFGLRHRSVATDAMAPALHERFHDALVAAWQGHAEIDGFQALVLEAGLTWRQVAVFRAYAKYLRQIGSRFSQEYLETTLRANTDVVRLLSALFETHLDPQFAGDRDSAEQAIVAQIESALDGVASLDEDRMLRSFMGLIRATLRTNYYQAVDGAPKPYLALKLDSRAAPDVPEPRPFVEIFVYSPRVEGVHLRFGPVARGGIRYSDRREDFRTEVLGLAKTQTVKNAVIVPVGSKGGFVVKKPPQTHDRQAQQAEVVACYTTLIRGLLDLTDNLVVDATGRTTVRPTDTVCHDGDDSYLVVAADKGTATFSDIANGISAEYGFWLGDAFASGGSAGYDHKAMGITARGAWESVTRHFAELGVNCQATDFTCVGIGDMSGDVFGNGMLLSPHTRLLAAFDHRHIFIDPDPDPAVSLAERQRLFALAGSSWADYDASLISVGGGVWPRTAKSIVVSAEMALALGIDEAATALAPTELMQAILRAPVDLLWNGGIGTYVKAHSETHADVGDRANDAIRVDARDLRCRVVGEGGNLGFTQRARIEFALADGRINTDAIDNSAGVDTSDHEVNIKILLDGATRTGTLAATERGPLLASMTDEVAALVLRDNYAQNLALTCSQAQAVDMLHVHASYLDALEKAGQLVRVLEQLPDAEAIKERRLAGLGLTRPELAVLLAYSKITATQSIVASDLPDDAFAYGVLQEYFPTALRERFAAALTGHPLRREIIATCLANTLVNLSGSTFVFRLTSETAASTADIVRAHTAARLSFDVDPTWHNIEALDEVIASAAQVDMLLGLRQLLDRATRWFLANRRPPIDVPATAAQGASAIAEVLQTLPSVVRGGDADDFVASRAALVDEGVPAELAVRVVALRYGLATLSVVDIASRMGIRPAQVAEVHFALGDSLGLARIGRLIAALPRDSRWHTLARAAARDDLEATHAELTADVLAATDASAPVDTRIEQWKGANTAALARAAALLDDIAASDSADLATLSVALREVRALARAAALPTA